MVKSFKQYLKESIIDNVQQNYAVEIFDDADTNHPKLKAAFKDYVDSKLSVYAEIAPILRVNVIGGILTRQYNDFSDIDINVLFKSDGSEYTKKLLNLVNRQNAWSYGSHPVNFYIVLDEDKFNNANKHADNVYDYYNDTFIKKTDVTPINIHDYFNTYRDAINRLDTLKNAIQNDLITQEQLEYIPTSNLKGLHGLLKTHAEKTLKDLENFVAYGNSLINQRRDIYQKEMTPEEIIKYVSYNKLPQNVTYKMLEKYYYLDLIHKIEKVLEKAPPIPYKELAKILF